MDVHTLINGLKEDNKNNKLLNEIKESILTRKEIKCKELILETPPSPEDFRLKLRAKCLHGNIFEDMVLKTTLENCNRNISVVGSNSEDAKKKASKNHQDFQELFGKSPSAKYSKAMKMAGNTAWGILKAECKGNAKTGGKYTFAYEEWVPNSVSNILMKSLRADCVSRTGDFTTVVDLKFSTMGQESYEREYLIDGITQVLIYSALMDLDPNNHAAGVLVYYGKDGGVVYYSTDKYNDESCMKKLYKKAGIPLSIFRRRQSKIAKSGDNVTKHNFESNDVFKKNCKASRENQRTENPEVSTTEFSDAEFDTLQDVYTVKETITATKSEGQYIQFRMSIRVFEICFCVVCLLIAIFAVWRT